ncbi:MAG TPA: hypothetical protein PKA58_18745 [Polyangium sp.]|nr:hypothetical protein [Polyangium sp.]
MRQFCSWSYVCGVTLAASVCLGTLPVFAQDVVDEQKVTALFTEAREAFAAGDYATACPKFEEVVRLKPGLGARIGLGDCYRAQARLSKAWEVYKGVVDDVPELVKKAKGFTEQSKVQKRGDEAKARIKEIEPKLGWMVLVVPESVLGLKDAVIHLDGIAVDRAKFGVRMPVDRGEHVVDVAAPGKKAWDKTVALVEGAELSVTVQALEDEAPPVKAGPVEPPPPANTGTQTPTTTIPPIVHDKPPPDQVRPVPDTQNGFFSTQRIVGLGLGAAGAGALIVGAVFGNQAIEKRDASEAGGHCVANRCDSIGLPLRQESLDAANLSTGFLVGGGVALAAGAAIFLLAPKQNGSARATLVLGPSSLHCIGRF